MNLADEREIRRTWARVLREIAKAIEEEWEETGRHGVGKEKEVGDLSGRRVRITCCNRYYKQEGEVVGRRSSRYWNIRLDGSETKSSLLIYKQREGFELM